MPILLVGSELLLVLERRLPLLARRRLLKFLLMLLQLMELSPLRPLLTVLRLPQLLLTVLRLLRPLLTVLHQSQAPLTAPQLLQLPHLDFLRHLRRLSQSMVGYQLLARTWRILQWLLPHMRILMLAAMEVLILPVALLLMV